MGEPIYPHFIGIIKEVETWLAYYIEYDVSYHWIYIATEICTDLQGIKFPSLIQFHFFNSCTKLIGYSSISQWSYLGPCKGDYVHKQACFHPYPHVGLIYLCLFIALYMSYLLLVCLYFILQLFAKTVICRFQTINCQTVIKIVNI